MASASCGRSVLNSCAKSSKRACCCKLFSPGGRVADSQPKAVPAIAEIELALEIGRTRGRLARRRSRAACLHATVPSADGRRRRKRVARQGRFSRASAGCQAGLPLGSRRRGGQPVGAISAGPTDRLRGWDAVWGGWPRRFVRSRLLAGTLQTETQCPCGYCHQEPNPQSPLLCGGHLDRKSVV